MMFTSKVMVRPTFTVIGCKFVRSINGFTAKFSITHVRYFQFRIKSEIVLTETSLGGMRIGRLARLARTGFVDGSDSELILISFHQSVDSSYAFRAFDFSSFHVGGTKLVFHFNDVSGNGCTTVSYGRFPF